MAKVLVDKLGVFGGQFSRRSLGMAVSCPGGQLTRGQLAAVSCRVPFLVVAVFYYVWQFYQNNKQYFFACCNAYCENLQCDWCN